MVTHRLAYSRGVIETVGTPSGHCCQLQKLDVLTGLGQPPFGEPQRLLGCAGPQIVAGTPSRHLDHVVVPFSALGVMSEQGKVFAP